MRKKENIRKNKNIYIVIGTRAQLIKTAPVMVELKSRGLDYIFIWTGQHKETIAEIINNFDLPMPDRYLYNGPEIKSPIKGALWLGGILIKAMAEGLKNRDRGIVLIHGDASSALIGLVYGKFMGSKIGHVEAGYRSFNLLRPFPEEFIRVLVAFFADFHFAPGEEMVKNLKGKKGVTVNTNVNTLYDALKIAVKNNKKNKRSEKYAVVNIHRFENVQNKKILEKIVKIILDVSRKIQIVFVLHPTTEYQLKKFRLLGKMKKSTIKFIPRQDYLTYINLIIGSEFVITDSGGNQQETSYMGHPCLLLRKETEGKEGLGKNVVISGLREKQIIKFVDDYPHYRGSGITLAQSPSKIIVDFLVQKQLD